MSSDRAQKIIHILHGDHTVSPHLTSLKNEALDVSDDHLTRAEVVIERPRETRPNILTPINLNLTTPIAAPKKRPHHRSKLHKKPSKPAFKFPRLQLPKINVRATAAFVLLAFAIVTPLKAITTYEQLQTAKSSVESLRSDAKEGVGKNFDAVSDQIIEALRTFHSANQSLQKIDPAEEFVLRHTPVIGAQ
ncbi:MAG: hypothetical protein NT003_00630, partial [Candidatus Magasanikbacteria bacterium]|nr:hypothetical protein [Candidatus Magasanikbacteria bacterium]